MLAQPAAVLAAPSRPLTVKERALWTLQRLFPGNGVSNETLAFTVRGRLDRDVLAEQLWCIAARHAALRTVFPEVDGEPVAVVLPEADVVVDLEEFDEPLAPARDAIADFAARAFDLTAEIPIRVGLWRGAGGEGDACCIVLHHVVYDVRTLAVVLGELATGYSAAVAGEPVPDVLRGEVVGRDEPELRPESVAHWRAHIWGVDPLRQRLDVGREEPDNTTFAGAVRNHQLSPRAWASVGVLAKRYRCTENIVLLAALYLLLAKHGAGPDLVIGVSVNARGETDQDSVGHHANTLPLRAAVDRAADFAGLLRGVRDAFLSGLEHRDVPYEALLPGLRTAGTSWRTPIFRYIFNYRPMPVRATASMGRMTAERIEAPVRYCRQDLEFIVETGDTDGLVRTVYSTELFDESDVRALQERYDRVLATLADNDREPLADVVWWTAADRAAVDAANATTDRVNVASVPQQVVRRAIAAPDAVAVVDGEAQHTYSRLLAAAADVRDRLRVNGVEQGDVVAVHARRGAALAAAVLGAWAVGAAYLPLHSEHPAELLSFQLADSGATALLTDLDLPEGLRPTCAVLPMTDPAHVTGEIPDVVVAPDATAYVIYTSGSTGRPKAVELTHRNLANVVEHFRSGLDVAEWDAVLWLTTFAFDISALELFLPLVAGGRVVVAPHEVHGDPESAVNLVRRHDVRVVQATPTTWRSLVEVAGDALAGRVALCGGEPLLPALAADLLDTGCLLFNVYGPTETTIWSTAGEVAADRVDVGTPLRNTKVFVAGRDGEPLPPGVIGELCIAGEGVARGYPRLPELTADRFRTATGIGRYYRTGDRARWLHDGRIGLLGRTDRQVKIRAHRVELGEVEAVLAEHPAVLGAAAVLRADLPADHALVAFVQFAGEPSGEVVESLWAHARRTLAGYALPARIVSAVLPRNGNGKVDHSALATRPLPEHERTPSAVPADGLVGELVELWRELLDDPAIGSADDFFRRGGNSLIAARMLTSLARSTGVTLTLTALLNAPTAESLAAHLQQVRLEQG